MSNSGCNVSSIATESKFKVDVVQTWNCSALSAEEDEAEIMPTFSSRDKSGSNSVSIWCCSRKGNNSLSSSHSVSGIIVWAADRYGATGSKDFTVTGIHQLEPHYSIHPVNDPRTLEVEPNTAVSPIVRVRKHTHRTWKYKLSKNL